MTAPALDLSRFGISELVAIFDAAEAAAFAWQAVANMPRCSDAASSFIEDQTDDTFGIAETAIAELRCRVPANNDELGMQTICLLRGNMDRSLAATYAAKVLAGHRRAAAKIGGAL